MIIKRKYASIYRIMQRDPAGRQIIEQAYTNAGLDDKEQKRLLEYVLSNRISLSTAEKGSGIVDIEYITKEFERFDAEQPYDNGLTFADVTRSVVLATSKDKLALCLISDFDGDSDIVTFVGLGRIAGSSIVLMKNNFEMGYDPYQNIGYGQLDWQTDSSV